MRVAKACSNCRTAKRRCTTAEIDSQQCLQRNQPCSLAAISNPKKVNQPKSIVPHASASSGEVLLELPSVNMQTREHLVDLYLQPIHDKPHTLFHPPTLRAQVREDAVPRVILFSIMALAARYASNVPKLLLKANIHTDFQTIHPQDREKLCQGLIQNGPLQYESREHPSRCASRQTLRRRRTTRTGVLVFWYFPDFT